MGYNLNFLSNNVNGLNSSKKQIKIFEYFREKIPNNGILFLQETHWHQLAMMILKVNCFFHTEPQIHVASLDI